MVLTRKRDSRIVAQNLITGKRVKRVKKVKVDGRQSRQSRGRRRSAVSQKKIKMTEIFHSPQLKLDHQHNHHKRNFDEDMPVALQSLKRPRCSTRTDIEIEFDQSFLKNNEEDLSSPSHRKTKRTREEIHSNNNNNNNFHQEQFHYELNMMKAQYEDALIKKDNELSQFKGVHQQLHEENRILKRGIAIQEQKLREAHQQGEELQDILTQAAVKMMHLEKDNQVLRQALYGGGGANFIVPDTPPDVY